MSFSARYEPSLEPPPELEHEPKGTDICANCDHAHKLHSGRKAILGGCAWDSEDEYCTCRAFEVKEPKVQP